MKTGFLCIGHCCHDKVEDGFILGGTASYAAMIAKAWDLDTKILTSVSEDFQFYEHFESLGIPFHSVHAPETTCFHNIYNNEQRTQYILSRAETLTSNHLPEALTNPEIVLFGLIADEVNESLLRSFPNSLTGASIQGFLRQWDKDGLISPKEMDWRLLQYIDIVILSDEDIKGFPKYIEKIKKYCNQVVMTHGLHGATVYKDGETYHFPSFPSNVIDPTGAGDVFTTAYIIEFHRTKDIKAACIHAHCAASFIIEGIGITNLPSLEKLSERKNQYIDQWNKLL